MSADVYDGVHDQHTSWTMLPDNVSQACTTMGELTCSFHLPSGLLPDEGATGKANGAADVDGFARFVFDCCFVFSFS